MAIPDRLSEEVAQFQTASLPAFTMGERVSTDTSITACELQPLVASVTISTYCPGVCTVGVSVKGFVMLAPKGPVHSTFNGFPEDEFAEADKLMLFFLQVNVSAVLMAMTGLLRSGFKRMLAESLHPLSTLKMVSL